MRFATYAPLRNLEDLGGIARLMSFMQDGINFIEVGTQEATPGRESVKYT